MLPVFENLTMEWCEYLSNIRHRTQPETTDEMLEQDTSLMLSMLNLSVCKLAMVCKARLPLDLRAYAVMSRTCSS